MTLSSAEAPTVQTPPVQTPPVQTPAARARWKIPYLPALDGLRAIALLAVLCFHSGFTWISGGYLPLSSFFVLSGFLITALLLRERAATGHVDLRAFWGRRARRLVPAIVVTFGLITLFLAFGASYEMPGVVGDGASALGWVTNWRFILSDRTYADAFADPSPFQHFWSLAVEEQFYLVVPVLAAGLLAVRGGRRWPLAVVVTALVVASVAIMRAVHTPGDPPLRAYFGTDTRAAELLVGVLLALVLVGGTGLRRFRGPGRVAVEAAGAVALVATVVSWFVIREFDDRLYEGGLLLIAVLAALVVTAATQPGSVVARTLSLRPLVALGRISYGVYLFHWPLFLWFTEERTGLSGWALFAFRLAITLSLAALSWRFVERPILERRLPRRVALVGWANATTASLALIVAVAAALPSTGITLRVAGADETREVVAPPTDLVGDPAEGAVADGAGPPVATTPGPTRDGPPVTAAPSGDNPPGAPGSAPGGTTPPPGPPPTTPPPPLRVLVVGDSIGQNLATGLIGWLGANGQISVLDQSIVACTTARGGQLRFGDGSLFGPFSQCERWPRDYPTFVADFDPDMVVVHTGAGEMADRRQPEWPDFRGPGDPAFDEFMVSEYAQVVDLASAGGAKVLWATSPCARNYEFLGGQTPDEGLRRTQYLNRVLIPRLASIRSIQVIDLYRQLCPGDRFTDSIAGVSPARPDGTHLSDTAAVALADQWLAPEVLRAGGR